MLICKLVKLRSEEYALWVSLGRGGCATGMVTFRVERGICHKCMCGGGGLRRSFLGVGIGAPPFPCKRGFGLRHSLLRRDWGFGIPHSAAAGALAQQQKKAQRTPGGALCFFAPIPRLQKQAFDARYGHKKSPQAMLESFFLLLCGERGIRTPGTVTRTSV